MIEQLKSQFERLKKVDINLLKREGKDFDFVDVYPLIQEFYNNWLLLENDEKLWSLLPVTIRSNIINSFNNYLSIIEEISRFNPRNITNPKPERDNMAQRITNEYQAMFNNYYYLIKLSNYERRIQEVNYESLMETLDKKTSQLIDSLNKKEKDADEIIKAMKIASAETGVSKYADIFRIQADKNRNLAIAWFVISALSAIGIAMFLQRIISQLLISIGKGVDLQLSVQIFIAKILLLSFSSVIFYQIVKNYNANMHLYTLNKHRENSLKSFQAFVQATTDPKTKDAVLLQATRSIFESGDTGYITSKEATVSGFEITKIADQALK